MAGHVDDETDDAETNRYRDQGKGWGQKKPRKNSKLIPKKESVITNANGAKTCNACAADQTTRRPS